jgi:hypothetical protein
MVDDHVGDEMAVHTAEYRDRLDGMPVELDATDRLPAPSGRGRGSSGVSGVRSTRDITPGRGTRCPGRSATGSTGIRSV